MTSRRVGCQNDGGDMRTVRSVFLLFLVLFLNGCGPNMGAAKKSIIRDATDVINCKCGDVSNGVCRECPKSGVP